MSDLLESSMQGSPLAPSVEKAYYRKCIELKRRLNEVEAANDEAKTRKTRLDRGIMKMRVERAFLLNELRKRMDYNVDGSEGSGDEGITTPPTDRPHRDKRRRQHPLQPAGGIPPPPPPNLHLHQRPVLPSSSSHPSHHDAGTPLVPGPNGTHVPANARDLSGNYIYLAPQDLATIQQQIPLPPPPSYPSIPPQHYQGSPLGAPVGMPGAAERQVNGRVNADGAADDVEGQHEAPISREAGAAGEVLSAGPTIREDANGDRRIVSSALANNANAEMEQQ